MKYKHEIVIDTVLPFAPRSENGLVVDYDADLHTFILKPELRAWLNEHPSHMSYKKTQYTPHGYVIYLNFYEYSDLLLFKLTWGGR